MDDQEIYDRLKELKATFDLIAKDSRTRSDLTVRLVNLENTMVRLIDLMLVGIDPEPATEIIHDEPIRTYSIDGRSTDPVRDFEPSPAASGNDTRGCGKREDSLPGDSREDGSAGGSVGDGADGN